jgi:hypothetical protein
MDRVWETSIGDLALRSTRDVVGGRTLGKVDVPKAVDKLVIVQVLIAREGRRADEGLEIQVEAVDGSGTERPRLSCVDPCVGCGSKGSPEEICKVLGDGWGRKCVVEWVSTTDREQDLLSCGLACLDSWLDGRAAWAETTLGAVRVGEHVLAASVGCVCC